MTVSELIAILQTMPQDAPVEMTMNGEYQCEVTESMVTLQDDRFYYPVRTVVIDNFS